jgi:hypothetical protein
MKRSEVIHDLCAINGTVGRYFGSQYAYDCLCSEANHGFQFEEKVLEFIRDAVNEKIERDGKPKSRWEVQE